MEKVLFKKKFVQLHSKGELTIIFNTIISSQIEPLINNNPDVNKYSNFCFILYFYYHFKT